MGAAGTEQTFSETDEEPSKQSLRAYNKFCTRYRKENEEESVDVPKRRNTEGLLLLFVHMKV